jgi:NADPH-dependent ferric siderophore reductase
MTAGGSGFADFAANDFTDRYIKLLFGPPGVQYPEPYDLDLIHATMPRELWPVTRTYTVRAIDPIAREITIDFVLHGDEGLAGPWAAAAEPGDEFVFLGPGGAYSPSPEADWHLLAGDEAAIPAIGAALEAMPEGVPAQVFIEVADEAEHLDLPTRADLRLTWLHRDGAPPGDVTAIVEAVKSAPWLDGEPQVFVHGESGLIKGLRRWFLDDRAVPKERLSLSGYWRTGLDEQHFREWKAEQKRIQSEGTTT